MGCCVSGHHQRVKNIPVEKVVVDKGEKGARKGCGVAVCAGGCAPSCHGGGDDPEWREEKAGRQLSSGDEDGRDLHKEYLAKLQFLAAVPLMKRLPKDQHSLVASVCHSQDFEPGNHVIQQGEIGDTFYIIRKGEARIHVADASGNEQNLALLRAGDYFGENSLLRDEPRMASVTAETALQTFVIRRNHFQELGLNAKLRFANRMAVLGGNRKMSKAKDPVPKKPAEYRFIAKALKANENLEAMIQLADDRVKSLIDFMWTEKTTEGQEVISKGTIDADYFYIVQDGLFEVFGEDDAHDGELKRVKTIGRGGSFGELALLYLTPRAATVVCKERGLLWVIDRQHFKKILMQPSEAKKNRYMGYLDKVSLLDPLARVEKEQLAETLVEMHYKEGEDVIKQGETAGSFYILYDGRVDVIKDDGVAGSLVASQGNAVKYFGERSSSRAQHRATVRVTSDVAKLLVVDHETFTNLIGPLKDLLSEKEKRKGGHGGASKHRSRLVARTRESGLVPLKELKKVGLMGYKDLGRIELWEHQATAQTFQLKRIHWGHVIQSGIQENILNEKEVMFVVDSPFILTLYETYCSSTTLSFLLEPALGGNLHAIYHAKGFHGSERHARYYVACAVQAIEHLHERRIIYRDLKPENLVLDRNGCAKLSDFGLAKFVVSKTYTTCGTPDYLAPEVIANQGHNRAVDWWALGVLLFEFMAAHPPFEDMNPTQVYKKVIAGIESVFFPLKCQGRVGDLICELLRRDPYARLPMQERGVIALKEHVWFQGLDWDVMQEQGVDPPFRPIVRGEKDLSNYMPDDRDKPADVEFDPEGENMDWAKDFATA